MKKYVKFLLSLSLCISMLFSSCSLNKDGNSGKKHDGEEDEEVGTIEVSNTEDFLDAIENGAEIIFMKNINFSSAIDEIHSGDYSKFEKKHKNIELCEINDGVEIVIKDIDGLTLSGKEGKDVELQVEPRYADVIRFENCKNISISNLTIGHTPEQGTCMGDVLEFVDCEDVTLKDLDLYGCGAYGITASNTTGLSVENSTIRDCSYGMLWYDACDEASFKNCSITGIDGYGVIDAIESEIVFEKCTFDNNNCGSGFVIVDTMNDIEFEECSFGYNETVEIYNNNLVLADGLSFDEKCIFAEYETSSETTVPEPSNTTEPESTTTYTGLVDSPEAILEALERGGDIKIEDGYYNLSEYVENIDVDEWNATHQHVVLENCADGHDIWVVSNDNMNIYSASGETWNCEIIVDPRHANVLSFGNCNTITITGIEFGHSEIGECNGSVLCFDTCDDIWLYNLDLFGCGVYGLDVMYSGTLHMYSSNIHDCEYGPAEFYEQKGNIYFSECSFTDSKGGFYIPHSRYETIFYNCIFGDYETTSIYFNNFVELVDCTLGEIVYYPENSIGSIEDYYLTELTVQDYYNCFYEDIGVDNPDYEAGAETYWEGIEYFFDGASELLPTISDTILFDSYLILSEYEYSIYKGLNKDKIGIAITESSDGKYMILTEVDPETGIRGDNEYYLYFYSTDGSACPDMCKLEDGDFEIWYTLSYS